MGSDASSGYCDVMMLALRERISILPSRTQVSARTPSHLISKSHFGSVNGFSPSEASIGASFSGILASRAPVSSAGCNWRYPSAGSTLSAISLSVRPLTTETWCSSIFHFGLANSSLCLISSHSFPLSLPCPRLLLIFTSTKLPRSFLPRSVNFSSPLPSANSGGYSGGVSNVPVSHTIMGPAPYWPSGITSSKRKYSSG